MRCPLCYLRAGLLLVTLSTACEPSRQTASHGASVIPPTATIESVTAGTPPPVPLRPDFPQGIIEDDGRGPLLDFDILVDNQWQMSNATTFVQVYCGFRKTDTEHTRLFVVTGPVSNELEIRVREYVAPGIGAPAWIVSTTGSLLTLRDVHQKIARFDVQRSRFH